MGASSSAGDDDASEVLSNGNGDAAVTGLPSDAQATPSAAAFSALKQEFVADDPLVKQEFDGGDKAVAAAGSSGQPQSSYPLPNRMFSSPATTSAPAVAVAGGSSLAAAAGGGMNGGGGPATPLVVVDGEQEAKGVIPGALLAAHNAAASAKAAAGERRGFLGDAQKRDRFDEFVTGFLSISMFHAADVWLPLASGSGGGGGRGGGNKKVSRLFVYSSNVQDPALTKWSNLSRNVVLATGVGLPGIVFQERRPQWAVREKSVLRSVATFSSDAASDGVRSVR